MDRRPGLRRQAHNLKGCKPSGAAPAARKRRIYNPNSTYARRTEAHPSAQRDDALIEVPGGLTGPISSMKENINLVWYQSSELLRMTNEQIDEAEVELGFLRFQLVQKRNDGGGLLKTDSIEDSFPRGA